MHDGLQGHGSARRHCGAAGKEHGRDLLFGKGAQDHLYLVKKTAKIKTDASGSDRSIRLFS